ncbi:hypothetical protein D3C76_1877640 [compost metagenome]
MAAVPLRNDMNQHRRGSIAHGVIHQVRNNPPDAFYINHSSQLLRYADVEAERGVVGLQL